MRIKFTSRLSLLLLTFMVAMLIFPGMAFAETVAPDGTTGASPADDPDRGRRGDLR